MTKNADDVENADVLNEAEYKYQFLQSEDYSPQTETLSLIGIPSFSFSFLFHINTNNTSLKQKTLFE